MKSIIIPVRVHTQGHREGERHVQRDTRRFTDTHPHTHEHTQRERHASTQTQTHERHTTHTRHTSQAQTQTRACVGTRARRKFNARATFMCRSSVDELGGEFRSRWPSRIGEKPETGTRGTTRMSVCRYAPKTSLSTVTRPNVRSNRRARPCPQRFDRVSHRVPSDLRTARRGDIWGCRNGGGVGEKSKRIGSRGSEITPSEGKPEAAVGNWDTRKRWRW